MIWYLVTLSVTSIALAVALVHEVRQSLYQRQCIARLEMHLQASMAERNRISRRCVDRLRVIDHLEWQLRRKLDPQLDPPPCQRVRGVDYLIYHN